MVSYILTFMLKKFYMLEMMSGLDELQYQWDPRNGTNIVAFERCAKIDNLNEFRQALNSRICAFSRLKSGVKKVCGRFMFEE